MGVQASEEEFQLLFDAIDLNGDGKISLQEWLNGMHWLKKSMRIQDAPESAPAAAASTKPRLERKKSLAEFSAEVSKEDAGRICELFKMIDKNSSTRLPCRLLFSSLFCEAPTDGKITRKELLQVLQESGVEATPQDADKLLEQLDTDHDGVISFLEFQQGIRQLGRALEYLSVTDIRMSALIASDLVVA
jgi:Ca2+-binding EF-hand superfamily protein